MKFVQKTKAALKKNAVVYGAYSAVRDAKNFLKEKILDKIAVKNFKAERKIRHSLLQGKIRVGFVMSQELAGWTKLASIFDAMKDDCRFDITLICLPPWIGENRILFEQKTVNTNYKALKARYAADSVKVLDGILTGGGVC